MAKYGLLRDRVARRLVPPHELVVPEPASAADLERVHRPTYIVAVASGDLSDAEMRRIGFPWTRAMAERARRSVGATIEASRAAFDDGAAVNLAGGTHHSYPDHGEGFCVFNDIAVAARTMQAEGRARRVAVIDTDVHQGDGTARIFHDDDSVFTFSVHAESNFPFRKQQSDLDIGLPDSATDDEFLSAIGRGLDAAFGSGPPDILYYLAGADAFERDLLGRLSVSSAGLAERDRMVVDCCVRKTVPLVVVMGGGYGAQIEETVSIHYASVEAASRAARTGGAADATRR